MPGTSLHHSSLSSHLAQHNKPVPERLRNLKVLEEWIYYILVWTRFLVSAFFFVLLSDCMRSFFVTMSFASLFR
jgi:hypothetical protein